MTADVVVVGAGVVGCAAARLLAREGVSVLVVDRDEPGRHASWAAAGMLAPQAEAEQDDAFFELLLQARELYPALAAELREETGLDIGYRTEGMLLVALDAEGEAELRDRHAWQRAAGLEVRSLTGAEAREIEPVLSPNIVAALQFPGDHQVDNRILVRALWFSGHAAGVRFASGRGAARIDATSTGARVELEGGDQVEAGTVVLAAGAWSGGIDGLPRPIPTEPVHGQLIALETAPPVLRHTVASHRGYLVPRADGRLIVGATADRVGFRTAVTPAGLRRLTDAVASMTPDLASRPIAAHWSGLRPGTPDGRPIVGPDPDAPRLIYATGHYRNGILLGPITGEIVRDLVLGNAPEVDLSAYRPDRWG